MASVFIETSAILSVIFQEPTAEAIRARLQGCQNIVASRLMQIEVQRALLRLVIDKPELHLLSYKLESDFNSFLSQLDVFQITEKICKLAGEIAPKVRLRSLDAIHIASYTEAKKHLPDLQFITLDDRLNEALERVFI
jgi:predicted nucleic acid-binding protein